jgi:hypothetical protein
VSLLSSEIAERNREVGLAHVGGPNSCRNPTYESPEKRSSMDRSRRREQDRRRSDV